MKKKIKVSIVIPTYNRVKMLTRLIDSVLNNTCKDIEIIIVNDQSEDHTVDVVKSKYKEYSNVQIITPSTKLFVTGCRNFGLQLAKGKFIFLIDDDNVLHKEAVLTFVTFLERYPNTFMVSSKMSYLKKPNKIWWAGTKRDMTTSRTRFNGVNLPVPNKFFWYTDDFPNAWMLRREIIDNKILFNEFYKIHYEESDFARRVIQKFNCHLCVLNHVLIYHDVNFDNSDEMNERWLNIDRVFYTARNRVVFHRQYSTIMEFIPFILFWNWLFTLYYIYFIWNLDTKNYFKKIRSILAYLQGSLNGVYCKIKYV